MDAITLIKKDHQEVEALFKKFEKAGEGAQKLQRKLVDDMIMALSQHAAIEEAILYPTIRAVFEDADDDVLEALEEHHVVKWTLAELEKLQPSDERFCAKVTVLIEMVRHHVEEEEGELLPMLRERMDAKLLQEMGKRLAQAKKLAPTHPHPRSPDAPPGNLIANPMAAMMDKGMDMVRELLGKGADRSRKAATDVADKAQGMAKQASKRTTAMAKDVTARGRKAVQSATAPRRATAKKGGKAKSRR